MTGISLAATMTSTRDAAVPGGWCGWTARTQGKHPLGSGRVASAGTAAAMTAPSARARTARPGGRTALRRAGSLRVETSTARHAAAVGAVGEKVGGRPHGGPARTTTAARAAMEPRRALGKAVAAAQPRRSLGAAIAAAQPRWAIWAAAAAGPAVRSSDGAARTAGVVARLTSLLLGPLRHRRQ